MILLLFWVGIFASPGCKSVSEPLRLAEFESAGPIKPQADVDDMLRAKMPPERYLVSVNDVLELQMPVALRADEKVKPETLGEMQQVMCRVDPEGRISLPMAGPIAAAGRDLSEIEKSIVNAYYPRYVTEKPAVLARVSDYHTQPVSVVGAVMNPGTYHLRLDELTLVNLLLKAGGIRDNGAAAIVVHHAGEQKPGKPILLPVRQMNIPFMDIRLTRGDQVEVLPLNPEVFTVIGLVQKPGAFPYPPGCTYNVMQAMAFAGGINEIANPQYVRVYRQKESGDIVDVTLNVHGIKATDAMKVCLKPGDVVSVEHTLQTDMRLLLAQIFRVNFIIGGSVDLYED